MTIALSFVFEACVLVAPAQELGTTPHGRRRVIPITGGRFDGPRLSGVIRPGSADWQLIRRDDVTELEARYTLETADGILVSVVNRGLRHGPPAVMERLMRGEPVDPASYYFRTTPVFEAPAGSSCDWLNRAVFAATGERRPGEVRIRVFEML